MLIDVHTHIGGEKLGFVMTEEMILEEMEKYHVDYCIVSNGDSAEFDHEQHPLPECVQVSQKESFLRSIRFARKYPDKIGIMPWIKPATETADAEFETLIKENLDIVKGIKVHPFHSNTFFDSERIEPYLKLAQKYELPVMSHTGGSEAANAKYVCKMARKYPTVKFFLAHMGLGTDNKEAIDLLAQADNLYGDTAWVPAESVIEVIKRFGSKRILFGSDSPIDGVDTYVTNPNGEPSLYQNYFHGLEQVIGTEAFKDLMYRNAMDVFRITLPESEVK